MSGVLQRIYERSRQELNARLTSALRAELAARARDARPPRDFASALTRSDRIALIAEIKFASPSSGELRSRHDVEELAWSYASHGADALSVLTEPHEFQGDLSYIARAKSACPLPVLRKDFLFDEFQIVESRAYGADAVLLIAAMLERQQLLELCQIAKANNLSVLLELHDEHDLAKAQGITGVVWGVNHRNLSTLEIDLSISEKLFPRLPHLSTKVAESGIEQYSDLEYLRSLGAHAALVGTSLMRHADPGLALARLLRSDVD